MTLSNILVTWLWKELILKYSFWWRVYVHFCVLSSFGREMISVINVYPIFFLFTLTKSLCLKNQAHSRRQLVCSHQLSVDKIRQCLTCPPTSPHSGNVGQYVQCNSNNQALPPPPPPPLNKWDPITIKELAKIILPLERFWWNSERRYTISCCTFFPISFLLFRRLLLCCW